MTTIVYSLLYYFYFLIIKLNRTRYFFERKKVKNKMSCSSTVYRLLKLSQFQNIKITDRPPVEKNNTNNIQNAKYRNRST